MSASVSQAESSFLLWFLGVGVYVLAAHVGLTAVRLARRATVERDQVSLVLTAGLAWGAALSMGFVLGLAGAALRFGLGFQWAAGLALWLLGSAAAAGVAHTLVRWPGRQGHIGAGVALGVLALVVQAGWLWAAGFRPGLVWRPEVLAAAGALMAVGLSIALGLAFSEQATSSHLRVRWRLAAAGLTAAAWLAGQEILLAGQGLSVQIGSVYQHQLPAPLLSLIGGALLPIALAVVAFDLRFGRYRSRRHHRDIDTTAAPRELPKRRRKYRIRGL
jgi:hypothetical protein